MCSYSVEIVLNDFLSRFRVYLTKKSFLSVSETSIVFFLLLFLLITFLVKVKTFSQPLKLFFLNLFWFSVYCSTYSY